MTSTKVATDGSRATLEVGSSNNDTSNNDLCSHCLRALTINDQLAGGTIQVDTSDGTTTLDISGFTQHDGSYSDINAVRRERTFDPSRMEKRDASGWISCGYSRTHTGQFREFCAGNLHERVVTLPRMLEISESTVGTCRLCSRLRALFIEQYAELSWWNEHGATLRFTIQYEWSEGRSILSGTDGDSIPPSQQSLDWLAVLVSYPGQDPNKVDVYQFDVVAWPGQCQKWLKVEFTPLDPEGPTSDRNIRFMRHCIDKCISDHPECNSKRSRPTFIPRRLLDLGEYKAAWARLIEPGLTISVRHPEPQLQYATLSYCWGTSLTMKTTIANKEEHETQGIDVQTMPATFQDAIDVAKKLGIRYLWIDALCIVQDDKDDWESEAVTMCDVFAHSQVTISAARSSSSAEHFLQRPADETLSLHFQSTLKSDISGQYFIRLEPKQRSPASQDIKHSAWVSRAWVWQEEIMSARQVVFGNRILQFRCNEGMFLEDGRHETDLYMLTRGVHFWFHAMRIYSSRTLTHATDRLGAIAGVAKFIGTSNRMNGKPMTYLVGLWQEENFAWQLRWVCKQPSRSCTELMGLFQDREKYIAPSWSWASRNTAVDTLVNGTRSVIRIIKTDLRASHRSAMVSVAFGSSITLSGKFRFTPVEPSSGRLSTNVGGWPHKWEASSFYGRTDFCLDWVPKSNDADESKFQSQLILLLTSEMDREMRSLGGLVIAPIFDSETRIWFFYRVGVFHHFGDEEMLTGEPEREITIR